MSTTFTRYVADLTTPVVRVGEDRREVVLNDFVIHAEAGTIAQAGLRGINRHSTILASITELSGPAGQPGDFPFVGSANMIIRNVTPRDDGFVSIVIHIGWSAPLNFRINLIVTND